jgi:hypothetical protein
MTAQWAQTANEPGNVPGSTYLTCICVNIGPTLRTRTLTTRSSLSERISALVAAFVEHNGPWLIASTFHVNSSLGPGFV